MKAFMLLLILGMLVIAGCAAPEEPPAEEEPPPEEELECAGPVCGADGVTYVTDCVALESGVPIIHEGACEAECIDSDGGANVFVSGMVTKGEDVFHDHCIDSQTLAEYLCLDNEVEMVAISCGEGWECLYGACVEMAVPEEPEAEPECIGPDKADIFAAETVTMGGKTFQDVCVDFKVVKNFYCRGGKVESINNPCPPGYGCTMGRCELQVMQCTDSDDGLDQFTRGRVQVVKGMAKIDDEWDYCIDLMTVREHYCLDDDSLGFEDMDCGSGYKCVDGACIKSKCSETDGGFNIYVKGTTTAGGESFTDYCIDIHTIAEYYCYGDEARMKITSCGPGYICNEESHRCLEGYVG